MNRVSEILKHNALKDSDSVLQEIRDPRRTSDRYNPIDHSGIIESFNQNNWFITEYQQVRPHKSDRSKYVHWLATYQNPDFEPAGVTAIPLILHQGSHDGSKPFVLDFGLYNLKKLTSVVVGDKSFNSIIHKHVGSIPEKLEVGLALSTVFNNRQQILDTVHRMQTQTLAPPQMIDFVAKAVEYRFSPEKYSVQLGQVVGDSSGDIWSLLTQVQKVLIDAEELKVTILASDETRKAKYISNIESCISLKKNLWNLAISYLVEHSSV